ncbi:general substrate transporter [Lipomyces tetrasporus]|uniref:General substrate transporter n=1 Tax=Lipomyces tetrasporus TaxID=54092 RepID=A0AAD7VPB5_9ASCO|nr:general substrate transporter [Lipomyces tetrasporus]KAJ8096521.1 general substrate transporter [Lipomyces tetrasporus]
MSETQYQQKVNTYTLGCGLFAVVGSLLYGIDSGIISTTISHGTFLEYFAPFTPGIKGAVVSTFSGGAFFGVLFAGWSADAWGRKYSIMFAAVWALIGGIIQAASINIGMLIAGRIIGGFAVGIMNMVIPVYNAEISPPRKRGLITGLHGQFVSIGFGTANWIGFACSYAHGPFQWRFPLAFQCLPAVIVLVGIFWLPFSPRWLLEKDRIEEAYAILKRLHGTETLEDEEAFEAEFLQMKEQIRYEMSIKARGFKPLFQNKSNLKRLTISIACQAFTQLTGVNVMNYYQTDLYKGLGITGHTVLLLSGIFGLVGPTFNLISILFVDSWGRKSTLWITNIAMAICIVCAMALTAVFQHSNNHSGKSAAIAFLFMFSATYSLGYNSIHYIYVPEIMSQEVRAIGTAIAVEVNVVINVLLNQVSPIAFANIEWKYYSIFIATNLVSAVLVFLYFPETKGKTLEEINELFGDEVIISMDEITTVGKPDVEGAVAVHKE